MHKSKKTAEILNFRGNSPNPIHSPSPDFATRNIIVSTKMPNSAQIFDKINLSNSAKKLNKTVNQQVNELRKQNNSLRNQIEQLKSTLKKSNVAKQPSETTRLIIQKDEEIVNLKSQLKQLNTTRLSSTPRKLNLAKSLIPNINQLQNKLSEVIEENQQLKKVYNPEQVKRLKKKIEQIEQQNNNLKNMISNFRLKEFQSLRSSNRDSQKSKQYNNMSQIKILQNKFQKNVQLIQKNFSSAIDQKILALQTKLTQLQNKYMNSINSIIFTQKKNHDEATSSGLKKLLQNSPMARGDSGKIHQFQDQIQTNPQIHKKQQKILSPVKRLGGSKNKQKKPVTKQEFIEPTGQIKNPSRKGISLSPQRNSIPYIDKIHNLQKQNEKYKREIYQLQEKFHEQQNKYIDAVNNLSIRLENLNLQKNNQISRLNHEIITLTQIIQSKKTQPNIYKSDLLLKNIETVNRQQQLQINRIKIDSLQRQNQQLHSKLKNAEKQLNQFKNYINKKKPEQKTVNQNDLDKIKIRMIQLENIIFEKNQNYYELENRFNQLNSRYQSQLNKMEDIIRQKNIEIKKLENVLYHKNEDQKLKHNNLQLQNIDLDLNNILKMVRSIDVNNIEQDLRYIVNKNIHITKLKLKQIQSLKKIIQSLNLEILKLKQENINLTQSNNQNVSKYNLLSRNIQKAQNQCQQYRNLINQNINSDKGKDSETQIDLDQYQCDTSNIQDVKNKVAKAIQRLNNLELQKKK